MKFGKSISVQEERNKDLHYVNFKLLKKKIKEVVSKLQEKDLSRDLGAALDCNRSFEDALSEEIELANACFETQLKILLNEVSMISQQITSATVPADAEEAGAATWFKELVLMLTKVDRLRKYAVWNAVAVVKILKKRRKQTGFGPEDRSAERAGWLSKNRFFNGSDFAELHVAVESLGNLLISSKLTGLGGSDGNAPGSSTDTCGACGPSTPEGPEKCPICLETLVDAVELDCKHRFCWRCFVLGPIAFQPGEYQLTQCPLCRNNAQSSSVGTKHQGVLSRFLHTYFPQSAKILSSGQLTALTNQESDDTADMVGHLVQIVLTDDNGTFNMKHSKDKDDDVDSDASAELTPRCQETPPGSPAPASAIQEHEAREVHDFFSTLPVQKSHREQQQQMQRAQKTMWIQLAQTGDPYSCASSASCFLCDQPLQVEEVVTTPCKHQFHRVCINRLAHPTCPICLDALPFDWFLPQGHPLSESGFLVVEGHEYAPSYPGGPSKELGGFPLHNPPPINLFSASGLEMRSFLHRLPAGACTGDEDDSDAAVVEDEASDHDGKSDYSSISGTGGSGSSSSSDDDDHDQSKNDSDGIGGAMEAYSPETLKKSLNKTAKKKAGKCSSNSKVVKPRKKEQWYYSAFGKMKIYARGPLANSLTEQDFLQPGKTLNGCQNSIDNGCSGQITPRSTEMQKKFLAPKNMSHANFKGHHKSVEGDKISKQMPTTSQNFVDSLELLDVEDRTRPVLRLGDHI